jgi:hypothetical protein
VALNKVTSGNLFLPDASFAVDGDYTQDNYSLCPYGYPDNNYTLWMVDLGDFYSISNVTVYTFVGGETNVIKNKYKIANKNK